MEYQAVVMAAGRASQMTDLTHSMPKCLLPIGNKPLIWFSLKMLENHGFEEAIVIVQEQYKGDIAAVPLKFGLNIQLDIFCIPKNEDLGTADSLRLIHDKIKSDVLIISCDLVTDVALHNLFDLHRIHQSSIITMFSEISPEFAAAPAPGPKSKPIQTKELVGLDYQTQRLIFLVSEADLVSDSNDEELTVRKTILKLFPQVVVRSDLQDAHLYIINKWVCDFIAENSLSMFKSEVLPHIVKKQFSKPANQETVIDTTESVISAKTNQDIYSFIKNVENERKIRQASVWNDHHGDLRGPYQDQNIRCFAYIDKEGFCFRANTLSSYCELNRQMIKRWSSLYPDEEVSLPSSKAQVGPDCLIGKTTVLSDKCSIKHSVIGQHCHIEDKVKIANCIIWDHVTIKEGTNLQGCVLLDNVVIEPRCDLKDSVVGSGHNVHASSKISNENLVNQGNMEM